MSTHEAMHRIRVHINGHPLEASSPISGTDLYQRAHAGAEEVLYREVTGNREDELVPRDAVDIHLRQDEHFYTAHAQKHQYTIIVNARRKVVDGHKISFEQVVKLAFPSGPPTPDTVYTVAFSNGPRRNPEGKMVPGQVVKIKDDMVFDVTETSRS